MKPVLGSPVGAYLPALALFAVTIGYLVTAYGYTAQARAFPVAIAWVMLGLTGLDLVSRTNTAIGRTLTRWLNPAADQGAGPRPASYPLSRQVAALAWVGGFVALQFPLGILGAIPVYVFASMRLRGRLPLLTCAIASAGVTVFIYLLFVQLLQIELYPGWLFGDA